MGRTAFFITDGDEEVPTAIKNGFERIGQIASWRINRRGLPLRNLHVFACYNYRSLPL